MALAGKAGQYVRGGRAFRQGILPWRKGIGVLPIPLRAFSSTPHRRTGGPKVKSAEPTARAAELHIALAGRVAPVLVLKAKAEEKDDAVPWRVLHTGREA